MGTKRRGQRDVGTKYHFFGHIETWAQRDVGTKYHFFGHIETWAQRDVGTKIRNPYTLSWPPIPHEPRQGIDETKLTVHPLVDLNSGLL